LQQIGIGRVLAVELDASLVAIYPEKVRALAFEKRRAPAPRLIADLGSFHLHDVRAQIGPDTEVVEVIQHIPAFRENGQFVGTDRYRAVLRAQRPPLREADFEKSVRADLLAQKLQEAVTSWVTVSEQEADAEYRRRNEKVKLDVVGFTADQFRTGLTATDAEAQAHYTKDPSRYKFGERRKVRYLTVDTQVLRASMTPSHVSSTTPHDW